MTKAFLRLSVFAFTITALAVCGRGFDEPAHALHERFNQQVTPFLKTHCLDCHGPTDPEAKLDLSVYDSLESVTTDHQTWAIILDRIASGEMPPKEIDTRPSPEDQMAITRWIRDAREYEAQRTAGDPGLVLTRRLSNEEYNNSIRDITGVDIRPTETFPVDPANEAGFDNSGESLTMSPALLRKYLDAARQVAEHLVLKPDGIDFAPHSVMTDTDRDKYCVKRIVQFYERQPTELTDYIVAMWKLSLATSGNPSDEAIAEMANQQRISERYLKTVWDFMHDECMAVGPVSEIHDRWKAIRQSKADAESTMTLCAELAATIHQLRAKIEHTFVHPKVKGIHTGAQAFVLWRNNQHARHRQSSNSDQLVVVSSDPQEEPDTANPDADSQHRDPPDAKQTSPEIFEVTDEEQRRLWNHALTRFCFVFPDAFYISERGRDYVDDSSKQNGERGRLLSAGFHSMMGYFRDDQPLYDLILSPAEQQELDSLWQELDFIASAPMRQYVGFLWFERTDSRYLRDEEFDFARPENKMALTEPFIRRLADAYLAKAKTSGADALAELAIQTYFDDINRQIRWVEVARQQAEPVHLDAILQFAQRAFRRPLSVTERQDLNDFYHQLRQDEQVSHEEAIQDMLVSVLLSPHFAYRIDLIADHDTTESLNDFELASRLSYFLWASSPDKQLLQAAEAGQLKNPQILVQQAQRMLQDSRARGLATEFAANWLDSRRFEKHNSVDRQRFPTFTDELRQAMFEEPIRLFMHVAANNRPIQELLYADYAILNPPLAKHYGIPLTGEAEEWSMIDGVREFGRGGLLTMSVFLTKNAPGLRTSPVKRGYWVVRRLLGERIPPPPPNVPELPTDESKLGDLTLRETLAQHREHPSCAGCHNRFDAIGLVFEGYGPVGEQRAEDLGGRPVDTMAEFPNGESGNGVADLVKYLQQNREPEFVENLCRKLLSYALSRSLILSDELLVRQMKTELENNGYQFHSLINTIITSPQFLQKRGRQVLAADNR